MPPTGNAPPPPNDADRVALAPTVATPEAGGGSAENSGVIRRIAAQLESTVVVEDDDRESRLRKGILMLSTVLVGIAGVVWGTLYLMLGVPWGAAAPYAYSACSLLSFGAFLWLKNFRLFRTTQLFLILVLPFAVHVAVGGYASSSTIALWAVLAPLGALMFGSPRPMLWFGGFVALSLIAGFFETSLAIHAPANLTPPWRATFAVLNIIAPTAVAFWMVLYFVRGDQRLRTVIARQNEEIDAAKKLGPYTLQGKIGQGGMGSVYRAQHALLRRATAVKLISATEAGYALIERFEREVQATSELSHPNIIEVYDFGKSPEGDFYYAMEYLDGLDLHTLVELTGPLPVARAVHILHQAADALHEAHARGLVHRDVKPANMILSEMGTRSDVLKVLDFGLVKDLDIGAGNGVTEENTIAGTPSYMSPEAIDAPNRVGAPSDVYALGCVAYFLLCGTAPFTAASNAQLWASHLREPPIPPSVRLPEIPEALDTLVLKCLEKDPGNRFADGGELSKTLAELAAAHPWSQDEARKAWSELESRTAEKPYVVASGSAATLTIADR